MVEFFSYFYRYSYCACINTTKILGIHRRGTVLRFRNNRTVTRFTFSGQGIQTAIWRSGTQSPENATAISFEVPVKLDHTSFIDGYIESTRVLIEQKGREIDLRKGYKGGGVEGCFPPLLPHDFRRKSGE